MLQDVQKRNGKIFEDHFKEVFGGQFEVECKWGFPIIQLSVISNKSEVKSNFTFVIDVTNSEYSLNVKGYKVVEEKEVPVNVAIDSKTIDFIVERTVLVTDKMFGGSAEEEAEEVEAKEAKAA